MRRRHLASLLLGLSLQLAGCNDDAPTTAAPTAAGPLPSPQPHSPAQPAAVAAPAAPFAYSPVGKRDPFRSYLLDLETQATSSASGRPKEPTEMYETDQYQLTAIISGTRHPKAMLEDPSGRGHVVHLGSHVGKHGGRIVHIGGHTLDIAEEALDASGAAVQVKMQKVLPRSELEDGTKR